MLTSKYTTWVGIDPGLHGAIACQYSNLPTQVFPFPLLDTGLDLSRLSILIDRMLLADPGDPTWGYRPVRVVVERVASMPGQGVASTFKFGLVTGALHGLLAAKDLEYTLVHPVRWKNRVLAGTDKTKLAAIEYCQTKFPDVSLLATPRSRKPHDGMADALCLSDYARWWSESENTTYKSRGARTGKRGGSATHPA